MDTRGGTIDKIIHRRNKKVIMLVSSVCCDINFGLTTSLGVMSLSLMQVDFQMSSMGELNSFSCHHSMVDQVPLTKDEDKLLMVTPLDFSYQCCLEDLHSTSRATKLGIMDPRNHPLIWKHSLIVSMVVPTLSGNSTTGVVNSWSKTYLLQCRNRLLLAIQQTNAWICSCCKIAVDKVLWVQKSIVGLWFQLHEYQTSTLLMKAQSAL
ncbi:hypothetical protein Tco_1109025 [Tanacetum coccineum]